MSMTAAETEMAILPVTTTRCTKTEEEEEEEESSQSIAAAALEEELRPPSTGKNNKNNDLDLEGAAQQGNVDDDDDDMTIIMLEQTVVSSSSASRNQQDNMDMAFAWISGGSGTSGAGMSSETEDRRRDALVQELRRVQRASFLHFCLLCLLPTALFVIVLVTVVGDTDDCESETSFCALEPRTFMNAFTTRCVCDAIPIDGTSEN